MLCAYRSTWRQKNQQPRKASDKFTLCKVSAPCCSKHILNYDTMAHGERAYEVRKHSQYTMIACIETQSNHVKPQHVWILDDVTFQLAVDITRFQPSCKQSVSRKALPSPRHRYPPSQARFNTYVRTTLGMDCSGLLFPIVFIFGFRHVLTFLKFCFSTIICLIILALNVEGPEETRCAQKACDAQNNSCQETDWSKGFKFGIGNNEKCWTQ